MISVEIDLNVRVRGNWTFTGLEDADGPIYPGQRVRVFEPESGLQGPGRVEEIDSERRLLFLSVDWSLLREPQPLSVEDLNRLGVSVVGLSSRGGAASAWSSSAYIGTSPGGPTTLSTPIATLGQSAVACSA